MSFETTKMHFEIKRINVQLEQLRAQYKHALQLIDKLNTKVEAMSIKKEAGNRPEETKP